MVDFEEANLKEANLNWTILRGANLEGTNLKEANLREAHYLTFGQLSKVKTLHDAKLDEKLLNSLRKEHARLFKDKYPHRFRPIKSSELPSLSSWYLWGSGFLRIIPSSVLKFEIHREFCIIEDYQQIVDTPSRRHFVIGNVT